MIKLAQFIYFMPWTDFLSTNPNEVIIKCKNGWDPCADITYKLISILLAKTVNELVKGGNSISEILLYISFIINLSYSKGP